MKNWVGIERTEGKTECSLCGNECENVSHVLWECSLQRRKIIFNRGAPISRARRACV